MAQKHVFIANDSMVVIDDCQIEEQLSLAMSVLFGYRSTTRQYHSWLERFEALTTGQYIQIVEYLAQREAMPSLF